MSSSERLEREAEESRERISADLDELRARMTPGEVFDELVDFANDSSGGHFFHNLRDQVVREPLPIALMGAGIAWLAFSSMRNGSSGHRMESGVRSSANAAKERASSMAQRASDAYGSMSDKASDTASRIGQSAEETAEDLTDRASRFYDSATEQAGEIKDRMKQSIDSASGRMSGAGTGLMDFLKEQPLVAAGLGLAIGAMLGAALPETEAENELMGRQSDSLKKQAASFTDGEMNKGKAAMEDALDRTGLH